MEIEKTCKKDIANCGNVVISGKNVEYTRYRYGKNTKINWRKLKNNIYVNLDTGEYIQKVKTNFQKYKNANITSVKHSIKNIRRTINCNFNGDLSERFITLTYSDKSPLKLQLIVLRIFLILCLTDVIFAFLYF